MDAPTTLARYDAHQILDGLMETRDRTKCCICDTRLGHETFMVCRFPDAVGAGMPGAPQEEHEGHTACKACVVERDYVGEKGSCKACYNALGGRRSSLAKAGIALIPPVRNAMANTMLEAFEKAEQQIRVAEDAAERERIRESVDRRHAAQDAAARKRGFKDRQDELAHRERTMREARDAEGEGRFEGSDWDDYTAWKQARDERAAREAAACAAAEQKATTEKLVAAQRLAAAQEKVAQEAAASASVAREGKKRKGRPRGGALASVGREEHERRLAKARRTREANKAKEQKLEDYDNKVRALRVERRKLDELWHLATKQVSALGGDPAALQDVARERFAEVEEEEEEEEKGEEGEEARETDDEEDAETVD